MTDSNVILDATPARHFDALFEADADPWHVRTRWYEARKRAVTLAALPRPRYAHAYEPGCANGELTHALADRCHELLATDASPAAVRRAQERLACRPHVKVACATTPAEWPDARFDLIVLSEFGYYLRDVALDDLIARCRASLAPGGTILACHWRHPADDLLRSGDDVHRRLGDGLGLARLAHHEERDFVVDVWSDDERSVAQHEGLA